METQNVRLLVENDLAAYRSALVSSLSAWLPLAGPFVAVVIASTLIYVIMWWREPASATARAEAAQQLQALGPAIARERSIPPGARRTAASDRSLRRAAKQVELTLPRFAWATRKEPAPSSRARWPPRGVMALRRSAEPGRGAAVGDGLGAGRSHPQDARGGRTTSTLIAAGPSRQATGRRAPRPPTQRKTLPDPAAITRDRWFTPVLGAGILVAVLLVQATFGRDHGGTERRLEATYGVDHLTWVGNARFRAEVLRTA